MKKLLSLLLCMVLAVTALTACGNKNEAENSADNQKTETPATETAQATEDAQASDTPAANADAAKTGLGIITTVSKSKDAGKEDGLAEVDSIVAAVLVGQDGKILDCKIDAAQTKINFSAEGKLLTDVKSTFKSKQELKEEYGLKKASGIGKEWYEQANALADCVTGKTLDEVKGIAVNEEGVATEADLTSSVTIHIGDFIAAIEKAVTNAQDLGAASTDKLGLGLATDIAKSTDASSDAEGIAQAYSYYTTVTTGADGKITSCFIDASQGTVNFNTKGTISTDLKVAQASKQELKEAYGMKKASSIGKEWYEQANAFAIYVTGKSVDEVKGIAVTEEGTAADADLVSSVTVHIGSFISTVEKAVASSAQ